jgi:uncharacterized phage protein (TIGR02218 family)
MLPLSVTNAIQSDTIPPQMYRLYDLGGFIRLTDAPQDIITALPDDPTDAFVVFRSSGLASSDSISNKEGSKIGNFSIKGVLTRDLRYSSFEALRGLYATVYLYIPQGIGPVCNITQVIFKGKVGITTLEGGSKFSIEILARLSASDNIALPQVTPSCILTVGSERCTVDMSLYTVPFVINAVPNERGVFSFLTATPIPPPGYFTLGKCRFTQAPDVSQPGIVADVFAIPGGWEVRLLVPLEIYLTPGMTGILTPGCDKTVLTCTNKYNNLINHLGAPGIPNINKRLRGV